LRKTKRQKGINIYTSAAINQLIQAQSESIEAKILAFKIEKRTNFLKAKRHSQLTDFNQHFLIK
jgi:hypothetical protein